MKDRDGHEMSRKWGGMKGKLYRGERCWVDERGKIDYSKEGPSMGRAMRE